MYYVTRKGEGILNFHARFNDEAPARNYAENLKATYGHNYDVIQVITTWTTQTLDEAMKVPTTTVADLRKQGVL
jgi:hypothetical protein